jgi:hypothetical protein
VLEFKIVAEATIFKPHIAGSAMSATAVYIAEYFNALKFVFRQVITPGCLHDQPILSIIKNYKRNLGCKC